MWRAGKRSVLNFYFRGWPRFAGPDSPPGSPHPAFTLPHQGGLIVECAGTTGRSDYDDGIRYRQRGAFLWRDGYSGITVPLS
jgi:hypothetical protein